MSTAAPAAGTLNKAVVVEKFDLQGPVVSIAERPIPEPQEGQVLVRITHRPVHPVDVFAFSGAYPGFQASALPAVPGTDGAGHVVRVGGPASAFSPGQRVSGAPLQGVDGGGTWQQYLLVREDHLVAIPDEIDEYDAAQFYINPHTSLGLVDAATRSGELPAGGWILNNAASSTVGFQITRLARKRGFKTVDVIRSEKWIEPLKAAGADVVLVLGAGDVVAEVKKATGGRGVDVAFDPVAGAGAAEVVAAVRDGGVAFFYGSLEGPEARFRVSDLLFRGVSLRGFGLRGHRKAELDEGRAAATSAEVIRLLADGTLKGTRGREFPLEGFQEALDLTHLPGSNEKVYLVG